MLERFIWGYDNILYSKHQLWNRVRYRRTEPSAAAIPIDPRVSTQDKTVAPFPVISNIKPATTDPRDAAANPAND
jgi:hypothetical protein